MGHGAVDAPGSRILAKSRQEALILSYSRAGVDPDPRKEGSMVLQILKIIGSIATIGTGLLAVLRPSAVPGFTGLEPTGPRGLTEIRAIFGGLFIGAGAYPLISGLPETYQMLGVIYLVVAATRLLSMFVDGSARVSSNLISLGAEIILGIILVL
jgi:hypothetical protein